MVFYYNVERRGASYDGMIEEAVTLGAVPCIVNDRLGEIGSTAGGHAEGVGTILKGKPV